MFFHGIIFTKQGQSHRPTGRGAGSRAATRKPLILLADSGRRILSRGPGICRGSAGDLPGIGPGERRPGARQGRDGQGIDGQGIDGQGIARGSISGRGPWARSRAVGFRAQGPERQGRDSLKIAPGPGQRKGPPESPLAGR